MAEQVTYKGVKRFGARYGRRLRQKLGMIEAESRKWHQCPYCNYHQVRKKAVGIFECSKCKAKFTGVAYSPIKPKTQAVQPVAEEEEPVKEEEIVEDGGV